MSHNSGDDRPCAALPNAMSELSDEGMRRVAVAALAAWKALPADERNGERPYIMGFNDGWDAALAREQTP